MLPPHLRVFRLSRQGQRLFPFLRKLITSRVSQNLHSVAPPVGDVAHLLPLVHAAALELLAQQVRQIVGQSLGTVSPDQTTCVHDTNLRRSFANVNPLSLEDGKGSDQSLFRMADTRDPYKIACGRRLIIARMAKGYSERGEFVEDTLAAETPEERTRSVKRLEKWENGGALVPPWFVEKLKRLMGITHDYIYSGDTSGMSQGLLTKILRVERNLNGSS